MENSSYDFLKNGYRNPNDPVYFDILTPINKGLTIEQSEEIFKNFALDNSFELIVPQKRFWKNNGLDTKEFDSIQEIHKNGNLIYEINSIRKIEELIKYDLEESFGINIYKLEEDKRKKVFTSFICLYSTLINPDSEYYGSGISLADKNDELGEFLYRNIIR
ncbi:MAG: hypothetical protein WC867_03230 [Candidatus Pacearchaeota archaeon]|jgi:hypothetical protein